MTKPLPKKKINYEEIEKYLASHKNNKPPSVATSDEQWSEALHGYYNMFLFSGAAKEFENTMQLWTVIYYAAMGFCRGMERQKVIDGTIKESLYPRY